MRSAHLVLLLMVTTGLGLAIGSRFKGARNAAAVEAPSDPTQLQIQWEKIQRAAESSRTGDTQAQSQSSQPLAAATGSAATNPVKNIRIMCPNLDCRTIVAVPETLRGTIVKCSNCGLLFRIPSKPPQTAPVMPIPG
jgi:hypothetical protein